MGFLDKAKKMAEQAQAKVDEVQEQFNDAQAQRQASDAAEVHYDEHGRPSARRPAVPGAGRDGRREPPASPDGRRRGAARVAGRAAPAAGARSGRAARARHGRFAGQDPTARATRRPG